MPLRSAAPSPEDQGAPLSLSGSFRQQRIGAVLQVVDTAFHVPDSIGQEESDGEVSQRGHVLRTILGLNGRAVFPEHKVFSIVQLVLDCPVGALEAQKTLSIQLIIPEVGYKKDLLFLLFPPFQNFSGPLQSGNLVDPRKEQFCFMCCNDRNQTLLKPAMTLIKRAKRANELRIARLSPVKQLRQLLNETLLIVLDSEDICGVFFSKVSTNSRSV